MIIQSLRLRGSIGIKNGLGLEDITVEFTKCSGGLIAIEGPNGAGKTTFIENLTPYLFLKSRPGALAKQFYLKDSCRDLTVLIGDDRYRFLINMNGVTGKIIDRFVEKNGECLNKDGKEETYMEIVTKLFGDADLFFSSLFMPQRRVPFSKLEPAKRKDMLLELIGAGHLQAKCDAATESAKEIKEKIGTITVQVESARKSGREKEAINSDITELTAAKTEFESLALKYEADAAALKVSAESLTKLSEEQAVKVSQLAGTRARLHELQGRLATENETGQRKIKLNEQFIDSDETAIRELEILTGQHVLDSINTNIALLATVKAAHESNIAESSKHAELRLSLANANAKVAAVESEHKAGLSRLLSDLQSAEAAKRSANATYVAEVKVLNDTLARLNRSVEILQSVPCQTNVSAEVAESCKSCQFLKDATAAVKAIEVAEDELKVKQDNWLTQEAELDRAIADAQAAKTLAEDPATFNAKVSGPKSEVEKAQSALNSLSFDSDQANKIKAELQRLEAANFAGELQQYESRLQSLAEARTRLAERQKQFSEFKTELEAKVKDLTEKVTVAQEEANTLQEGIDGTVELRIRDTREKLKKALDDSKYANEQIVKLTTRLEQLAEELKLAEFRATKVQEDIERLNKLQSDLADYDHLALALSRKGGFQSMLVETAGAEMTPVANELLALYGRPWTIEIATCRPDADNKKMVDGFFVIVNTPDGPRELSDLSGGEEVIVDQVIYDAIGNMLRRRSGLDLRTCIKDEADGALDGDRAVAYVKAIESAHQVSHLHHTIMISHREAIQQLIPQRLRFEPGKGISVEV